MVADLVQPVPTGGVAPTPAISAGSLSGLAVGGVAGAGILGGIRLWERPIV